MQMTYDSGSGVEYAGKIQALMINVQCFLHFKKEVW